MDPRRDDERPHPDAHPEEILGLEPVDSSAVRRSRVARRHEARLRAAYRKRRRDELIEEFHEAGLGAEAVAPMADVFSHAQFVANGMAAAVEDPELGSTTQVGVPAVLRGHTGGIQGGQPRAGAHSREVLTEAGYPAAEIDRLLDAGIVEDVSWVR